MIYLTGIPRSGIGIVADVLRIHGIDLGNVTEGTDVPENRAIRGDIIKPVQKLLGVDPRGSNPFPSAGAIHDATDQHIAAYRRLIGSAVPGIGPQDPDELTPDGVICSESLALLWPLFDKIDPKAVWVFVHRRRNEIVRSCLNTGSMTAYRNAAGWKVWHDRWAAHIEAARNTVARVDVTPYTLIGRGDVTEMRSLIESMDLAWKADEVADYIAPKIRREQS